MILRILNEIPPEDNRIEASVYLPFGKDDSPGVVIYWKEMRRIKLFLILLKAAWLVLTSKRPK
jgi:hypothetical protein